MSVAGRRLRAAGGGIFVGGGGSVRLRLQAHRADGYIVMLTGRTYSAMRGSLGFSYLVDGAGFDKGLELATRVCGNAPLTEFRGDPGAAAITPTDPRA